MNTDEVVSIISIERDTRVITVRHMPKSQRALIEAVCEYWKTHEMPWSITEVLRYDKPQRIFYSVFWTEGEQDGED